MSYREKCDYFMVINYGKIVDVIKKNRKVYVITENYGIFSLIEHEKDIDITNVVIRCSEIDYIEEILTNLLKKTE